MKHYFSLFHAPALALALFSLGLIFASAPPSPASAASATAPAQYPLNAQGYVRHWLVAGPAKLPYTGPSGGDDVKRRDGIDKSIITPPASAALAGPSPLGEPWRFYDPGENFFVECTAFYHNLARLDDYAFTELDTPHDLELPARLWAAGLADLWVNGVHVIRHFSLRNPEAQPFTLHLKRGANSLCIRLQCVGIRDTNMLFGLQILKDPQSLSVRVPGPGREMQQIHTALAWLWSVRAAGRDALVSALPAPAAARVEAVGGDNFTWSARQSRVTYTPSPSAQVKLSVGVAGQKLERLFEVPANKPAPAPPGKTLAEHRLMHTRLVASGKDGRIANVWQVLARRLLNLERVPAETAAIDEALAGIDARKDCSDFALSALLRMQLLGLATPEETARIKRTVLAFRYWDDEPGTDAMCFGSENHSLLFHGCQLLAGRLYPAETFSNSQRTGEQHQAVATARILQWLEKTEKNGYTEFLSSTYMPLTVGALLNLVDFSGDADIARRCAALADRVFTDLALQSFDRVTVGPQGRVYRNVLYPQESGTQALLSYATPQALVSTNQWVVFLSSSKNYQPPRGLEQLMTRPADKTYRHTSAEITVHKTAGALLTSLQIPASFSKPAKNKKPSGLTPGADGYQQHLWHATLGRDCHVFVNNPGGSFDLSAHRPGYWYGNGTIPRLAQREGMLFEIFDLPETNPFPFTHAHWPSDAFDRQEVRGHWAFGLKGNGCVALWCSESLAPHDEVLTGRELRAAGRRAAWLCVCASNPGGFEGFIKSCEALKPAFDRSTLTLNVEGRKALAFK